MESSFGNHQNRSTGPKLKVIPKKSLIKCWDAAKTKGQKVSFSSSFLSPPQKSHDPWRKGRIWCGLGNRLPTSPQLPAHEEVPIYIVLTWKMKVLDHWRWHWEKGHPAKCWISFSTEYSWKIQRLDFPLDMISWARIDSVFFTNKMRIQSLQ